MASAWALRSLSGDRLDSLELRLSILRSMVLFPATKSKENIEAEIGPTPSLRQRHRILCLVCLLRRVRLNHHRKGVGGSLEKGLFRAISRSPHKSKMQIRLRAAFQKSSPRVIGPIRSEGERFTSQEAEREKDRDKASTRNIVAVIRPLEGENERECVDPKKRCTRRAPRYIERKVFPDRILLIHPCNR